MGNEWCVVFQVVERLFSLLSDCMWEAPVAQAKHTIQIKERVQELKLQVARRYGPTLPHTGKFLSAVCSVTDRWIAH